MKLSLASCTSLEAYGGAEKWIINFGNELSARGHEVEIKALPFQPYDTGISREKVRKQIREDIKYAESWRPRLNHEISYYYFQPLLWRLFKCQSDRRIAGIHSPGLTVNEKQLKPSSLRNLIFNKISIGTLKKFHKVHLLNKNSNLSQKLDNTFYQPNWVDTKRYKPEKDSEKFGNRSSTDIGFVRRRKGSKGEHLVKEVAEHMSSQHYKFHSTGPKFSEHVRSHGFIPQERYPEFLASMDIILHPSSNDCFSLTILEALSSGTPVITKPIPASKQIDADIYFADQPGEFIEQIVNLKPLIERNNISDKLRNSIQKYSKPKVIDQLERQLKN